MKIAIQGHPTRGKDVIKILESLGGNNYSCLTANAPRYHYYNGNFNNIDFIHGDLINRDIYKLYTLEEFEKEFPFKIGDKVFLGEDNEYLYTIKSISIWHDGDIVYELAENGLHYTADKLTLYKEMKEERNVTLTLDKAKEWYQKGGELKEIALQAFTKDELNPLPRSWEEFCEKYPVKKGEYWIGTQDTLYSATKTQGRTYKNWISSRKSAEAHLAMIQLEQLRNCWWNGWEPIWDISHKWSISLYRNELNVGITTKTSKFLVFPTKEMAEEFSKCFRSLIEKAKDLI